MADDYTIKITTQGDPKGAESVAAALQKVGKQAGDTGKGARQLGDDLVSLGARQNATKDVIEGLDSALKGNAGSFFGLAKAAKNLWEILTVSTPVGRLIQLFTIAATAVAMFGEKIFGAGEKAKTAEIDINAAAEAVQKLNQVSLEKFKAELDAIGERSKAALDYLAQIDAAQKKLGDARMNAELAAVGADPTLSPEQRKAREFEIRQGFADKDSNREREAIQRRREFAQRDAEEKAGLFDSADLNRRGIASRVDATVAQRETLNALMRGLNDELRKALGEAGGDQAKALVASEAYKARVGPIEMRQGMAFGPAADVRLRVMEEQLRGAEAQAKAAREAASKAEAELLRARQAESIDDSTRRRVRGYDREAARIGAGVPETISDRGSFSTVTEFQIPSISVKDSQGREIGERIAIRMKEILAQQRLEIEQGFNEKLKTLQR